MGISATQWAEAVVISEEHDLLPPSKAELDDDLSRSGSSDVLHSSWPSLKPRDWPSRPESSEETRLQCTLWWKMIALHLRLHFWSILPVTMTPIFAKNLIVWCEEQFRLTELAEPHVLVSLECGRYILEVWTLVLMMKFAERSESYSQATTWYLKRSNSSKLFDFGLGGTRKILRRSEMRSSQAMGETHDRFWDFLSSVHNSPTGAGESVETNALCSIMLGVLHRTSTAQASFAMATHIIAKAYAYGITDTSTPWSEVTTMLSDVRHFVGDKSVDAADSTWLESVLELALQLTQVDLAGLRSPVVQPENSLPLPSSGGNGCPENGCLAWGNKSQISPYTQTSLSPSVINNTYSSRGPIATISVCPPTASIDSEVDRRLYHIARILIQPIPGNEECPLLGTLVECLARNLSTASWPGTYHLLIATFQLLESDTSGLVIVSSSTLRLMNCWKSLATTLLQCRGFAREGRCLVTLQVNSTSSHEKFSSSTTRHDGRLQEASRVACGLYYAQRHVAAALGTKHYELPRNEAGPQLAAERDRMLDELLCRAMINIQQYLLHPDETARTQTLQNIQHLITLDNAMMKHPSIDHEKILRCANDQSKAVRDWCCHLITSPLWPSERLQQILPYIVSYLDEMSAAAQAALVWIDNLVDSYQHLDKPTRHLIGAACLQSLSHELHWAQDRGMDILSRLWIPQPGKMADLADEICHSISLRGFDNVSALAQFFKISLNLESADLWREFLMYLAFHLSDLLCASTELHPICVLLSAVALVEKNMIGTAQWRNIVACLQQRHVSSVTLPLLSRLDAVCCAVGRSHNTFVRQIYDCCIEQLSKASQPEEAWSLTEVLFTTGAGSEYSGEITGLIASVISKLDSADTSSDLHLLAIGAACAAHPELERHQLYARRKLITLLRLRFDDPSLLEKQHTAYLMFQRLYLARPSLLVEFGPMSCLLAPLETPFPTQNARVHLTALLKFWRRILDRPRTESHQSRGLTVTAADYNAIVAYVGRHMLPKLQIWTMSDERDLAYSALNLVEELIMQSMAVAPLGLAIMLTMFCVADKLSRSTLITALAPLWQLHGDQVFRDACTEIWCILHVRATASDQLIDYVKHKVDPIWRCICYNAPQRYRILFFEGSLATIERLLRPREVTVVPIVRHLIESLSQLVYSKEDLRRLIQAIEQLVLCLHEQIVVADNEFLSYLHAKSNDANTENSIDMKDRRVAKLIICMLYEGYMTLQSREKDAQVNTAHDLNDRPEEEYLVDIHSLVDAMNRIHFLEEDELQIAALYDEVLLRGAAFLNLNHTAQSSHISRHGFDTEIKRGGQAAQQIKDALGGNIVIQPLPVNGGTLQISADPGIYHTPRKSATNRSESGKLRHFLRRSARIRARNATNTNKQSSRLSQSIIPQHADV